MNTTDAELYCRSCGYQVVGLSEPRCPECGRLFDPDNPRTFLQHPKAWRVRQWVRRILIALGSVIIPLLVSLGILLGILYLRWQTQQQVIASVRQVGGAAILADDPASRFKILLGRSSYWPSGCCMGVAAAPGLLGTRFAYLLDQAEEVVLAKAHPHDIFWDPPTERRVVRSDEILPLNDAWLQQWGPALQRLPRLKILRIYSSLVTDKGLKVLETLPTHVQLTICCPLASPQGLDRLKQAHPQLRMISLAR